MPLSLRSRRLRHFPAAPGMPAWIALAILVGCSRPEKPVTAHRLELLPLPSGLAESFSGTNAYRHVADLVALGPRPPGSHGFAKQLDYLEKNLGQYGWQTTRQSFPAATPDGPMTFTNVLARHSSAPPLPDSLPALIGGHIDTKKLPFEFLGANDGGSSTGILLELARVLATDPEAARRVEIVFFDGEEGIRSGITPNDGLYGSKYFARSLSLRPSWPAVGMVLDIVGDADHALLFNSDAPASLKDPLTELAARLGFSAGFRPSPGPMIDDHVPLQNTGLPCLHLIGEFQAMPYWHQPGDTLENISPRMLEKVGRLTLRLLADPRVRGAG